jgi:hypothetical protein
MKPKSWSNLQAYDASKKLILSSTPKRSSQTLSTPELAAAGFLSAIPTTLVMAPVERAKVLLQVRSPNFDPLVRARQYAKLDPRSGRFRSEVQGHGGRNTAFVQGGWHA